MQVFKAYKKIYLANELKSWILSIVFVLLLFFAIRLFFSQTQINFLAGVILLALFKLGDMLTQFHVEQIKVDSNDSKVTFILKSVIQGEKIKTYHLGKIKSELLKNSRLKRLLNSPIKIAASDDELFKIDSRYGFSTKTLKELDNTLKTSTSLLV